MWLLNLLPGGVSKDVVLWLVRVAAAGGALLAAYGMISVHHYKRGWAAHERAAQREVQQINAAREQLAAELAQERLTRETRIRTAVEEALESARAPVNLVGGGAEPVALDTIKKLNKIR